MQYANIMVSLGGDAGNTVPKYQTSASEIAVLRAIHGPGAVHDVEPTDGPVDEDGKAVKVNNRDELRRLKELYAGPNTSKVVEALYPGAAARVFEDLDDLEIPKELYKAKDRMSAADAPRDPAKTDREADGPTRRPGPGEQGSASRAETTQADDDGIRDMPDAPKEPKRDTASVAPKDAALGKDTTKNAAKDDKSSGSILD